MKALQPRIATLGRGIGTIKSWRDVGGKTDERGYTYAWKQARLKFLKAHPLCVLCLEQNLVIEATVVDHIVPHRGDKELFWRQSNWRAICKPHHDRDAQVKDHQVGP